MTGTRAAIMILTLLSLSGGRTSDAWGQKRQRDLITREELVPSDQTSQDVYRVVRSLRPHFLEPPRGVRTLGNAPPAPLVVYVDGSKQGDVEVLKTLLTKDVQEIRYLEPSKAQDEYGVSHSGGALVVKLAKFLKPVDKPAAKPESGG